MANKPITLEEMKAYVDATWEKCQAEAWQVQEPIAWVYQEGLEALKGAKPWTAYGSNGDGRIPLYVAPRQWQGLDDVEIVGTTCECVDDGTFNMDCAMDFARVIEAKLKERNT